MSVSVCCVCVPAAVQPRQDVAPQAAAPVRAAGARQPHPAALRGRAVDAIVRVCAKLSPSPRCCQCCSRVPVCHFNATIAALNLSRPVVVPGSARAALSRHNSLSLGHAVGSSTLSPHHSNECTNRFSNVAATSVPAKRTGRDGNKESVSSGGGGCDRGRMGMVATPHHTPRVLDRRGAGAARADQRHAADGASHRTCAGDAPHTLPSPCPQPHAPYSPVPKPSRNSAPCSAGPPPSVARTPFFFIALARQRARR